MSMNLIKQQVSINWMQKRTKWSVIGAKMQTEQPLDQKSISLNQFLNFFDQFKSLIWVDSLEVRFEVGGRRKIPPLSKTC